MVDEGKGRLNPCRDSKLRQASQKEGGKKTEQTSCVTFLMCDPGFCVHILAERCSLTSIINGMPTNKQKYKKMNRRKYSPLMELCHYSHSCVVIT